MSHSHDLTKLDERSFEHLANLLALRVLGHGHTGFGPGKDGGRDGYFEGEAPYPSQADRWNGVWYLQSKFHKPHLSTNPQKWLLEKVKEELSIFADRQSGRVWPDNWIFVTNIDPSGALDTGAFDKARALVAKARPQLNNRFHIWGGAKVLQLLALNPEIVEYYAHFLTPGHVLTEMYKHLGDTQASAEAIIRHCVVTEFGEQQFTKLEQAGSTSDSRPGIQRLFTDLPFVCREAKHHGFAAQDLASAAASNQRLSKKILDDSVWRRWGRHPTRSRIWFIKGGPGNGKSTITQYICQIQRAALILAADGPATIPQQRDVALEIEKTATSGNLWPTVPRIPVSIELKEFAKWFGERPEAQARGILSYLADRLTGKVEQKVHTGTLKRSFAQGHWLFVFDGLDEVPGDVKALVAGEVILFVNDILVSLNSDALIVCTSRPQGYSGQFNQLEAAIVELQPLTPQLALQCATPVLRIERTTEESNRYIETLAEALQTSAISEIMRTPLQAHIMAVVVRDGGRPPDRKWKLFTNFYQVIKKREANRNLPERRISELLRGGDKLLKSLHNHLGFELHARAEQSKGAQTSLEREELRAVVVSTVNELHETSVSETVQTLMDATTERLVLVTTPETSDKVRFDIRPLQEFFAAEYVYEDAAAERLGERLEIIGPDSHWREVMHFLLSAIIENSRQTDLTVAINKLADLNDRFDGPARSLFRRLGLGAVIAARLLHEGVLEQDKRVRHQFRRCLEPMFGSTEVEALESLVQVTALESRKWLIDVLADAVTEQTENESIGAAYVLCFILPDDHPRVAEVTKIIEAKSVKFLACLISMLSRDPQRFEYGSTSSRLSYWSRGLLMKLLASDRWEELGEDAIASAFGILKSSPNTVFESALIAGFDKPLANHISNILMLDVAQSEKKLEASEQKGLVVHYHPVHSDVHPDTWSEETWSGLSSAKGAFACLLPVYSIAAGKGDILGHRAALAGKEALLDSFPENVRAFIPEEFAPNPPTWRYKAGYAIHSISFKGADASTIAGCIAESPEWGIHHLAWRHTGASEWTECLATDEGKNALAEGCLAKPDCLRNYVGVWGKIIEAADSVGKNIKPAIMAAALADQPIYGNAGSYDISTFKLTLPDEAALLPFILNVVADRPSAEYFESTRVMKSVTELLEEYISNAKVLVEILSDEKFSTTVRASAAMLALLHPASAETDQSSCIASIVDHYRPGKETWYLKCAGSALSQLVYRDDREAINAMGMLLRAGVADFSGRLALTPILEQWRQKSRAPVHGIGLNNF